MQSFGAGVNRCVILQSMIICLEHSEKNGKYIILERLPETIISKILYTIEKYYNTLSRVRWELIDGFGEEEFIL